MAKTEKKSLHYSEELRRLRESGPARVYLLRGEEDFLRDSYLKELREICVPEGTEAFNYHRLDGPAVDLRALREAADAMPFMGGRTFIEVRGFDINRTAGYDADELKAIVADMPDWATAAFVFAPDYVPDGRLGAVKAIKKAGVELEFTAPREAELVRWVQRRVESQGRRIDGGTASYLLWVCGTRMSVLIPELVKICGAAAEEEITRGDIDAVAKRSPETTIFSLTDALGEKDFDKAAGLLADLLADRDEPPQKQIAMVSEQYRRLFVARMAQERGLPESYITDCVPELTGRSYPLRLLRQACRRYSLPRLARAVKLCEACDLGMKSNGPEPPELMKELLLRLALDTEP